MTAPLPCRRYTDAVVNGALVRGLRSGTLVRSGRVIRRSLGYSDLLKYLIGTFYVVERSLGIRI